MMQTLAVLSSRTLVRIGGEGWRPFLQGLLTQDVAAPAPSGVRYAALLNPQGRLLHDLMVIDVGEEAILDVAASGAESLVRTLSLYRLRAKVAIAPAPGQVLAAFGSGPPPEGYDWRRDPRTPDLGWRALRPAAGDPAAADPDAETAYRRRRIELGVADASEDGRETDYPIELNLDLLNAIDFHKGCFVGQETTSRMHRRGAAKNRLTPITYEGPAPAAGSEIMAGGLRAGEARTGVAGRGLALLRLDRAGGALSVGGRPAIADPPTWLKRFFQATAETAADAAP